MTTKGLLESSYIRDASIYTNRQSQIMIKAMGQSADPSSAGKVNFFGLCFLLHFCGFKYWPYLVTCIYCLYFLVTYIAVNRQPLKTAIGSRSIRASLPLIIESSTKLIPWNESQQQFTKISGSNIPIVLRESGWISSCDDNQQINVLLVCSKSTET